VVSPNVGDGAVDLSLVLPTYREGRTIQKLLQGVCNTLRSVDGLRFEVIVVDDNSPDGTAALAVEQRLLGLHEVKVIHRSAESGLATAVIRGWQAAQGRILAVMDADFQHPPPVLLRLLQAIQTGADLSIASRHVQEGGVSDWSLFRRIISRTAQLIGLVLLPDVV
jgi:dolichol-phosphate mannosyltransferase